MRKHGQPTHRRGCARTTLTPSATVLPLADAYTAIWMVHLGQQVTEADIGCNGEPPTPQPIALPAATAPCGAAVCCPCCPSCPCCPCCLPRSTCMLSVCVPSWRRAESAHRLMTHPCAVLQCDKPLVCNGHCSCSCLVSDLLACPMPRCADEATYGIIGETP